MRESEVRSGDVIISEGRVIHLPPTRDPFNALIDIHYKNGSGGGGSGGKPWGSLHSSKQLTIQL